MADIATVVDSVEMHEFQTAVSRCEGGIEIGRLSHHGENASTSRDEVTAGCSLGARVEELPLVEILG